MTPPPPDVTFEDEDVTFKDEDVLWEDGEEAAAPKVKRFSNVWRRSSS